MQGHGEADLFSVQSVASSLPSPGGVFAVLVEYREVLFPDSAFADLFPSSRGRPSVPAPTVAAALVLQSLFQYSDREVEAALTFDLRWKAACGIAIDQPSFHYSVLALWRARIAASARPGRIFELVGQVVAETGVVKGKKRRALDSTIVDDAVARQDTVTQLISQIRRVGRQVPQLAGVWATLEATDYGPGGKPVIDWHDEAARDLLVTALVNDALALIAAAEQLTGEEALTPAQADAVALLALVAGQDVEPADGSDGTDGRWQIARQTVPDRVISTVDPDARHARKTRADKRDGFKAHVVVEPDTGIVTTTQVTGCSGKANSDGAIGQNLITRDPAIMAGEVDQLLGDSAYTTPGMLHACDELGLRPLLKPHPLPSAVPGGFTIDDFDADLEAGQATCPAGHVRPLGKKGTVTFGPKLCAACPLRQRCTTSTQGRKLILDHDHQRRKRHRDQARDPGFQDDYRHHRPMVERTLAWMSRGARKAPYRGITKNDAWWQTRAAGINLKRLTTLGLTRHNGTWAITAA